MHTFCRDKAPVLLMQVTSSIGGSVGRVAGSEPVAMMMFLTVRREGMRVLCVNDLCGAIIALDFDRASLQNLTSAFLVIHLRVNRRPRKTVIPHSS